MKTKRNFLAGSYGLLVLFFLCSFFLTPAFAQKSDFTGSWKLNESKSTLGEYGSRMVPLKLTAQQDANTLVLDQVSKGRNDEERTTNAKFALDGSESENTVFQNFVRKSKSAWSADGKTLTINSVMNFERDGQKTERKSTETWKLSADGKTLTIETVTSTPNGDLKQTRVYDKV